MLLEGSTAMRIALYALLGALLTQGPALAQSQAAPTSSLTATHGSWEVWCDASNDCIMTQLHRRTTETADAVFTIFKPKNATDNTGQTFAAAAEIVVPLGVFLPGALGLQIDASQPKAVPFERCIPDAHVVRVQLAAAMLAQMKAGSMMHLIVSPSPVDRVRMPISLNGFTAAFDSL